MDVKEMVQDIDSLEIQLLEKKLALVVERAYQQGVEDGQSKYKYPELLKQEDLVEILQAELPTVRKLVARRDFPKFEHTRARYPRDAVFEWIKRNSTDYGTNLLRFKTN
ncbi:helix-turn-helix domain-containing protein [Lysinibacillus halotolerans]|uniref:DNA-binding protein n=1 Tax=Lysinibacillus halotolerans TaxID=1368476 RepID=A0A3M8HCQ3_9BACI|nr:helix-turn-helix domain-containing protein [Lysinibacillus halotolerans]RND00238.1 DNA-binding protein [Lysinibacillus halotolerans]